MAIVDGGEAVTKIITIATPAILDVAKGFIENQQAYAIARGYGHEVIHEAHWNHLHPSFSKVYEIQRVLKDSDNEFIIWADADVAFMDFTRDLTLLLKPEHFLSGYQQANWQTWKYICNGLLVIRNCPDAVEFTDIWADRCINGCPLTQPGKRTMILDHPWEQWTFDGLVREKQYHGIYAATAKEIGCFCPEIWHDGVKWESGMPTIHMAGPATFEKRAEVFAKIYSSKIKC